MMRSMLIDQVAEVLGVSRRTVYYRIRDGRLRTVRTAGGSQRVLVDSVRALLDAEDGPFTAPAAGASNTALSVRSPAP
jgi:excisionase family DNA binding protein